jgi:outer membrane murein-binding lipoprotein Lpp
MSLPKTRPAAPWLLVALLALAGCGEPTNERRIERLEDDVDDLEDRIEELEEQLES